MGVDWVGGFGDRVLAGDVAAGGAVDWEDRMKKPDYKGCLLWLVVWFAALWLYGLAGSSDLETSEDLTAGVDRAEVMAWAAK